MTSPLLFLKSNLVWISFLLIFCTSFGLSHGESNAYHRLQGVELCLDDRSVSVAIDLGESDIDGVEIAGRLEPTLKSYITTTLSNSLVTYNEAKLCPEGTLLQSLFDIRPSGYDGDPTLVFSALTHVGIDVSTQEESTEETSVYYSFDSSLEFVEDYVSSESFTIDTNKSMTLELVQNWWEDNPEAIPVKAPRPLPQILGASLSLLILVVGLYFIKR